MAAELYQSDPLTPARFAPNSGMKVVRQRKKADRAKSPMDVQKSRARSTALSSLRSMIASRPGGPRGRGGPAPSVSA